MYVLDKTAARIVDFVTANLPADENGHRRIGGEIGKSAIMPLCVERLDEDTYSLAHYFILDDEMCQDPDVVLLKREDGSWLPVSFHQAVPPIFFWAVELDEDNRPATVHEPLLRDLVTFCNRWMRNVRDLQNLKIPAAKKKAESGSSNRGGGPAGRRPALKHQGLRKRARTGER